MALKINTEILIQATPEQIWTILTDFSNYPTWNPFIKSIRGEVRVGNKIEVKLKQSESNEMKFKPTIQTVETNKTFSWLGRVFIPGLFDGKHQFDLIDHDNGTTTFKHTETFTGILVPLLKKQLINTTQKGFEAMNEKLKELAEKG